MESYELKLECKAMTQLNDGLSTQLPFMDDYTQNVLNNSFLYQDMPLFRNAHSQDQDIVYRKFAPVRQTTTVCSERSKSFVRLN